MLGNQDQSGRTQATKSKWRSWLLWLLLFIPLFVVFMVAENRFGFRNTFPLLAGLLAVTLLYQRFVKKRTWRSIMWGNSARNK